MGASFPLTVKGNFEFIMGMVEAMIDTCPDKLWTKKAGGFVFWQQLLHATTSASFFLKQKGYEAPAVNQPEEIIHLKAVPTVHMTKAELKALVVATRAAASVFLDKMPPAQLGEKHEALSAYFGRDFSNEDALVKLLWHTSYHLGCCDALLREEGIPGVF